MNALENLGAAVARALDEEPVADVLSIITGTFVGLVVSMVQKNGHNPNEQIKVDGGNSRDITIHAEKNGAQQ